MDPDEEAKKFKWLLRFGIGLLVTSFFAWGELTYAVFGKNADATITKVERVQGRRGSEVTAISYRFTDSTGAERTGSDVMDADWDGPRKGTIPIVYRSGPDGKSRLAGHVNWIGIIAWLTFFVPTIWVVGSWIKESVEYSRENKRHKARMK
jgi:hypothetical protein